MRQNEIADAHRRLLWLYQTASPRSSTLGCPQRPRSSMLRTWFVGLALSTTAAAAAVNERVADAGGFDPWTVQELGRLGRIPSDHRSTPKVCVHDLQPLARSFRGSHWHSHHRLVRRYKFTVPSSPWRALLMLFDLPLDFFLAIQLGGLAAKKMWQKRMKAKGKDIHSPGPVRVLCVEPVKHFFSHMCAGACRMW